MIFIDGGGEFTDFQTIIDTMKSVNYTIDRYPRTIELYNFITKLNDEVTETIDVLDYRKFDDNLLNETNGIWNIRSLIYQTYLLHILFYHLR